MCLHLSWMPCRLDPAATLAELPSTPVIAITNSSLAPPPHLPDAEPGGKGLWPQPEVELAQTRGPSGAACRRAVAFILQAVLLWK